MKRIHVCLAATGLLAVGSVLILRPSAMERVNPPQIEKTRPLSRAAHPSAGETAARSTHRVEMAVNGTTPGTSVAHSRSRAQFTRTAIQSGPARTSLSPIARQPILPGVLQASKAPRGIVHDAPLASAQIARTRIPGGSPQDALGLTSNLPPALPPAALIELDDPAVAQADAQRRLTAIASDFTDALNQSGLDPADPGYRQLWDREQASADARFRSMYGGQAWMNHHIQSHHAQSRSPMQ